MARVKCVMMQRDETLLLEPWLRYYGYLFGFENLTVFDNGSVEASVIDTLKRFEGVGVRVYWDFAGYENFDGKAFHFSNIIRGWDFGGDYAFALPIDCDEFLAVLGADGIDCRRNAIHATLDALIGEEAALGIEFSMFNVPGEKGVYRPQYYPKGFLARGTLLSLDKGQHYPATHQGGRRETTLTYLHYHYKPFAMMVEHARRKLEGVIDLDRPETAVGYTGSGNHLLKFLSMSEKDYRKEFARALLVRYGGFEHLLRALGPVDPSLFPGVPDASAPDAFAVRVAGSARGKPVFAGFTEQAYYDANPDVLANRIEGLRHFFRHGFVEGRRVRADEPATSRMAG